MEEITIPKDAFVMCSEPSPDLTIQEANKMLDDVETEAELATLFSIVENKVWWIEDEQYDFDEGTKEHKAAVERTKAWFSLSDKIKNRIFDILKSEGIEILDKGQIVVLEPFMRRNGYKDGRGWWIENDK